MIGDSLEADIEGALNIGMNAIHFIAHGEDHHSKCKIIQIILFIGGRSGLPVT